jgi:hypothetical protein
MGKAFFINGGVGRVLCAIPALEEYSKNHDDFVIVSEGWPECFAGHPTLQSKVYDVHHKNLFESHLRDKEIISPEPYRLNAYYNQKCNLIQAFDMLINGLDTVPVTKKMTINLSKKEQIDGHNMVNEIRQTKKKKKTVVFQPFGSTARIEGNFVYDTSGRSFELNDIIKIIESLTKNYAVIIMSTIPIPVDKDLGVAFPQNMPLRTWMGVINASDLFLGCDSAGQHIAYALNKPSVVVTGGTFPVNISYPNTKDFTVIDNGADKRKYSPLRITMDDWVDRVNEELMILSKETLSKIVATVNKYLGGDSSYVPPVQTQPLSTGAACCPPGKLNPIQAALAIK